MGFDLTDIADADRVIFVNFWNWRPTVEIIRAADLLDPQRLDGLSQQCSATQVSVAEARAIAHHLRIEILPALASDARVLLDGSSTTAQDDGTFHRDSGDFDLNYSATRTWLQSFATFCESCGGFEFN